jgi:hypothetical protein
MSALWVGGDRRPMIETCAICQHAKLRAIDTAIGAGLSPAVIAAKFHVAKKLVELHEKHWSTENLMSSGTTRYEVHEQAIVASYRTYDDRPSVRFKQAWQDAKDDQRERAHMVSWLNEQLQAGEIEDAYNG